MSMPGEPCLLRRGFILIAAFCICFVTLAEKGRTSENPKRCLISSHIEPSEFESNLTGLIKSHGYTYQKKIQRKFEIYFDTPEFLFRQKQHCLTYQVDEYVSKKNKLKYHEEIKFYTEKGKVVYPVKHYNRAQSYEGKHPFLGMVKKKDRQRLINDLKAAGVLYPMRLKMTFNVSKIIHSYAIFEKDTPIGTVILEIVESAAQKDTVLFSDILVDLTKSDPIYHELKNQYKGVLVINTPNNTTNGYATLFELMEEQVRFLSFKLKYPWMIHYLYAALIIVVGLIVIKILFWNRVFVTR